MPQRRTAKKDLRKNKKRHQENLRIKQSIKTAIKKLKKALDSKDTSETRNCLKETCRVLDKAVTKKILHKNKAARKKSRFSKLLKTSGSK